ncbi:TolC family protein [bacterium]|nr:TolC family protein [bacterium]
MNDLIRAIVFALATAGAFAALGADSPANLRSPAAADVLAAQVLMNNQGLQASRSALEAARHRVQPAGSLPDPRLSTHLAPNTIGGFQGPGGTERSFSGIVSLSQDVPWPGTLALRATVAEQNEKAAQQSVFITQLRLAALARIGYARWAYVHDALRINAQNTELMDELRRVAESRYAAGIAQQQDVLQAEVRLAQLRRERLTLQRLRRNVVSETNALLNRPVADPLPPPEPLPAPNMPPPAAQLATRAQDQHPQLARLQARLSAEQGKVSLAQKAYLPDLQFSLGYNGLRPAPDARLTVGASVNLPFGQSKRDAGLSAARASASGLRAELADRRARLASQVQQAHDAAMEALDAIAIFNGELIPRSRESLGAARSLYGSGGGAFRDVIVAEQSLLDARLDLARARADYYIAIAQLQRWTGSPLPETNEHPRDSQ